MFLFFALNAAIFRVSFGQQCRYRSSGKDWFDKCTWQCDGTDVNLVDMPFDDIWQFCNSHDHTFGGCTAKEDLIFPDDGCCPYCKCDSTSITKESRVFETLEEETCYDCSCAIDPSVSDTQSVYTCNVTQSTDRHWARLDFTCDTDVKCVDNDQEYIPGEGWWSGNGIANGMACNKLCYCQSDGTTVCKSGITEIFDDAKTKEIFVDVYGWGLIGCLTDTSLIALPSQKSEDGTCTQEPKCACKEENKGGHIWYSEEPYLSGGWISDTTLMCVEAVCDEDGYVELQNVHDLYNDDVAASNGAENGVSCPGPRTLKCHEESGSGINDDLKVGQLQEREFTFNGEPLCGWKVVQRGPHFEYDWDAASAPFCQTFGKMNECVKYSWEFTGECGTETQTVYQYCCEGENCNHQDINIDNCTTSSELEEIWSNLVSCMHDVDGSIIGTDCGVELQTKPTCETIGTRFEGQLDCLCTFESAHYHKAGDLWDKVSWDNVMLLEDELNEYNVALGCGFELTCNLEDGSSQLDVAAGKWIVLPSMLVLFMFCFN